MFVCAGTCLGIYFAICLEICFVGLPEFASDPPLGGGPDEILGDHEIYFIV